MRGKGQETRVVNRSVFIVPQHHHLLIIIQAGGSNSLKVFKGPDMLPDGGGKILGLDETEVAAARVTQEVTEQVDAAAAFGGEVQVVDTIIHFGLQAWPRLEAKHWFLDGLWSQLPQPFADDGVAAAKATGPQFLVQAYRGQVGIAGQQLSYGGFISIQLAGPPHAGHESSRCWALARALGLPVGQHPGHRVPGQLQVASNLPLRHPCRELPHDLIPQHCLHDRYSSRKSVVSSLTTRVSRSKRVKSAARSGRSAAGSGRVPRCNSQCSKRSNWSRAWAS